jgi:thiamine-phosphate pyrophosphorylase
VSPDARLPRAPFVYPIVDVGLVEPERVGAVVASLARAGARLIQLRAKGLGDRAFLDCARGAVAAAHAAGALLVVNDRPDVARLAAADGVHVGQDDLAPGDVRRVLGPGFLVGVSTHDVGQASAARTSGADYVAVGPVFATSSKAAPDPVVGLQGVAAARAITALPLVAIGGITRANAATVIAAGADAVAVISDLLRAPDPAGAFRAMQALIGAPR